MDKKFNGKIKKICVILFLNLCHQESVKYSFNALIFDRVISNADSTMPIGWDIV
jgi:hypothetical protein